MFRFIVALMVSCSLIGCTVMRRQPVNDRGVIQKSLKVGDEVSVRATNGKDYLLKLIAVDEQKIVGVGDNKKVTIRYEQIVSMEVRRVSAGRTVGLVAGIATGIVAVFSILVIIAFSHLDD